MRTTVYVRRANPDDLLPSIRDLLDQCRWQELVPRARLW